MAGTATADSGATSLGAPIAASPGDAATYQLNAVHDGHDSVDPLDGRLHELWRHDFGRALGYPLLVNGRVFVPAVGNVGDGQGAQVWAFDAASGDVAWGPVGVGGTYNWTQIVADGTYVYSVNFNGLLIALDQSTGAEAWRTQLGQYDTFIAPPTVDGGVIFVNGAESGATTYAVDTASGSILWVAHTGGGDLSSPAVTADSVYISYSCELTYRLDRWTGAVKWVYFTGCDGGGGETPVVHDDSLFVRDYNNAKPPVVLSTANGQVTGSFDSRYAPAFDGNTAFYTTNFQSPSLTAVDVSTGRVLWSATANAPFSTPPVVVDGKVLIGQLSGTVSLYDEQTGLPLWSSWVGPATADFNPSSNPNYQIYFHGLIEAESKVVASASSVLVVYGAGALDPTTTELTGSPNPSLFGEPVSLTATVQATTDAQPSGAVSFYDGTTKIGSATVSSQPGGQQATLSISSLSGGPHQLRAVYEGDTTVAPSVSSALSELVLVPTHLTATPAVVDVSRRDVYGFKASATLTNAVDHSPLAHERISFSAGSTWLCAGYTDRNGFASCSALTKATSIVLGDGYRAVYAGRDYLLPTKAFAGLT